MSDELDNPWVDEIDRLTERLHEVDREMQEILDKLAEARILANLYPEAPFKP